MSAPIHIGALRHRLTFELPADVMNDTGGATRAWAAAGEVWASIEPVAMRRRFEGVREEQVVTHHVVFRRRVGLSVGARLRKGARVFRVLAVEDVDATGRFQRAQCEEISP